MSSLSWSSGNDSQNRSSPERPRASPSPVASPPLEWSSDWEDHVPLAQRQAAREAPAERCPAATDRVATRGRRARAGTSSSVGTETPEGAISTVTGKDLGTIRARYQVPQDINLFLPTPDDRIISSRPGRVAIYEICFKVGLRLPFHPFFVNLLDYYSLTPSQLVPNSLRVICAFIILCCHLSITPRVSLFRACYFLRSQKGWWLFQPRPNRILKLVLPSSVKGWKPRFFFANIPQVQARWGNPDLRGNANPSVSAEDREAMGKLLATEIHRYSLFLTEENLRMAGIISQHIMKVPTRRLIKSAAKRKAREGPSEEAQAPPPKRPVTRATRASGPIAPPEVPAAPEIIITSDTSPERGAAEEVASEAPAARESAVIEGVATAREPTREEPAGEEQVATGEPSTSREPTPVRTTKDWGEGPSQPAPSPPDQTPASSPPPAESETNGRDRAKRGLARDSFLDDGRRVEQLISSIFVPELQQELSHLRAATFFRESYAGLIKIANSLDLAREVIRGGKGALREVQKEADDARARAEVAERALEAARTARADELEAAVHRAEVESSGRQAALNQLTEAESAVMARDMHIGELTAAAQAAEGRASEARERARAAEEKTAEAEERAKRAEEKAVEAEERAKRAEEEIETARGAERAAAEALAAEKAALAAKVEAAVEARTARVIEDFRASESFMEDLTEASTDAYLQGFNRAKEKIAYDLNFPPALEAEPDRLSEMDPSDDEDAPTGP